MKIRAKLGIMELVLAVGFLVALGAVIYYTSSILQLKDFQLQSRVVLSRLDEVNYRTKTLLTTNESIGKLRHDWMGSILNFQASLQELSRSDDISVLGSTQQEQLRNATGWWEQIYSWYYQPALNHLEDMEEGEIGELVGSSGIFQTLFELNARGESTEYIGDFYTLQNYQQLIIDETEKFVNRMDTLSENIRSQTEQYIRYSFIVAISVIFLTIIFALIGTTIFSRRLSRRIKDVESAIRRVAAGDFSHDLHIKSKDEFETLSENYNILKNQLQDKLNAVLNFMLHINTSLSSGPDLDRILQLIADSAVENTSADGAAVHLIENEGQHLVPKCSAGRFIPLYQGNGTHGADGGKEDGEEKPFHETEPVPIDTNLLGSAVTTTRPIFIRDAAQSDAEEFRNDPEMQAEIESTIITPLTVSNRVLGTITIEKKRNSESSLTDLDYTHMQTFADYAALTIESIFTYEELIEQRELRRDIQIAADIQNDLLPRRLPTLKTFRISAYSLAARGISGDYYDAFSIEDGKVEVVICDVVGKGVPASLLMVMIRTIIRLVASPGRKPAQLLTFLNKGIKDRIGTDHFATMSILHYDENERSIVYSNAAHPPLLVYHSQKGEFVEIDTPGLPIGVEKEEKYQQKSLSLDRGDILLLFTDGVPEARSRDGREYGLNSLKETVAKYAEKSPEAIQKQIRHDLQHFVGNEEQHDDQTLIVMKVP